MNNPLSRIQHGLASLARPTPARDWLFVLTLVVVVFLGVVVFAVYLFWGIRSGGIIHVPEVTAPTKPLVSRIELESVLEAYRTRKLNFEAHHIPAEALTDPSQ